MDLEFLYLIGDKSLINKSIDKELDLSILTEKSIIGDQELIEGTHR